MVSSKSLRLLFLNYFQDKGHKIIPSSSLIPRDDDKSLLFINAGMVPFKSQFSGNEPVSELNVTSVQRCLRAGGKHNDLENVGYTARHHTFFEMLGNFSFGDYFKREAIQFAWEFLTIVLKLPAEKLWVTVYKDDKESADIWLKELRVDSSRFSYCGDADNFWAMSDVGPCGPCSEIFYDHGPNVVGGPPGSPDAEGDRYVEIWNLVFMQYDRKADGELVPLPKPCVDTGMGLERLCAVMQGVISNYDIDLFQVLIKAAKEQLPKSDATSSHTLKVIADHIRAIGFLIADGVVPNNEGRGYVLRRIIRRALRHGYQAGVKEPFLYRLISTLVEQMEEVYPELSREKEHMTQTLLEEENQFLKTLHQGLQYFEKVIAQLNGNILSGHLVFKLYDTYGFPADLTAELAKERGLLWDETAFKIEMEHQRKRSQLAGKFSNNLVATVDLPSSFIGYKELQAGSHIIGLLDKDHQPIKELLQGEKGNVILDETPFYAEAGGQVGDQGDLCIAINGNSSSCFVVLDTQKHSTSYLHSGYVKEGRLKVGDTVSSQVDQKRRQAIKRHHSATHLLHAALRKELGERAIQKGSLVGPDYLRFDFQYALQLKQDDIKRIEYRVNQAIWDNLPVITQLMTLEEAQKSGAISLFEKYGEKVRVLSMGDFSKELCGGTHVDYTGEIGYFAITLATSVASGIKRIEAVTSEKAFEWIKKLQKREDALAALLKTSPEQLITRVEKQLILSKKQTSDISELKQYMCRSFAKSLAKRAIQIGEGTLVLAIIPTLLFDDAREVIDELKAYLSKNAVIALGSHSIEGIQINIGVTRQYTEIVSAAAIVKQLCSLIDGKGGGRSDFAKIQAKGDKKKLLFALKKVHAWLADQS